MAKMLKKKGYTTGVFGKWHLGHLPELMPNRQGFDEYFGTPYSNDMWPQNTHVDYDFDPLPLYHNEQVLDTLTDQMDLTRQIAARSVEFIDILPTISELKSSDLPELLIDGKSARRLFKFDTEESPQKAYFFYDESSIFTAIPVEA